MIDQFVASFISCDICTHRWVAVRPIETTELECPNCNHITFIVPDKV